MNNKFYPVSMSDTSDWNSAVKLKSLMSHIFTSNSLLNLKQLMDMI